jgi:Predicted integral membrane protein (DUF2269)
MRQTVKFLHTLSSCGLIGALVAYILVLWKAPQESVAQYADMREIISLIARYILVPSLGISLVSGLLSMMVHKPYQHKRWAWAKAFLGLAMFESTLAITQAKAIDAATLAAQIAQGENVAATQILLSEAIHSEWNVLFAILAVSAAQMALGIWRPKLELPKPA